MDFSEFRDLSKEQGVSELPTFKFYKAGKLLEDFVGSDPTRLEELIKKHSAGSAVTTGVVQQVLNTSEFKKLIAENILVVTDFYTDWCGPCKWMAPQFDELAAKYPQVRCLKVKFCYYNLKDSLSFSELIKNSAIALS